MFSLANAYVFWRYSMKPTYAVETTLRHILCGFDKRDDVSVLACLKELHGEPASHTTAGPVLHESDNCYLTVKPRILVNLSDFNYYGSRGPADLKQKSYFLQLKLRQPRYESAFQARTLNTPNMMLLDQGASLLAHKAGNPFTVICMASCHEYTLLVDAFFNGSLVSDNEYPMIIEQIARVDVRHEDEPDMEKPSNTPGLGRNFLSSSYSKTMAFSQQQEKEHSSDPYVQPSSLPANVLRKPNPTISPTTAGNEGYGESDTELLNEDNISTRNALSPNILVYVGDDEDGAELKYDGIHNMLCEAGVDPDFSLIYHLKHQDANQSSWLNSCRLLIIATRKTNDDVKEKVYEFYEQGGRVLSLCSDMDETFSKCIQFTDDLDKTEVRCSVEEQWTVVMRGPKHYAYPWSTCDQITLRKLASNQSSQVLVIEVVGGGNVGSRCVLCQVQLDTPCGDKGDNARRMYMVRQLLARLGVHTREDNYNKSVTPCYVYSCVDQAREEFIADILSKFRHEDDAKVDVAKKSPIIRGNVDQKPVRSGSLDLGHSRIVFEPAPSSVKFNFGVYKDHLNSRVLGNVLLYQELCPSTQLLIEPFKLFTNEVVGPVAVASRQLSGIGRGNNLWISPEGSLSMSMLIRVPLNSNIGKAPTLLQTIPAVAVARIFYRLITPTRESADARVSVKWPNDIYYDLSKIGGVLVSCCTQNNHVCAVVGIGVNVNNEKPSKNVNDIIHDYNRLNNKRVPDISVEHLAAQICSDTELLIDMLNQDKMDFMNEYYKYWMHSGVKVRVPDQGEGEYIILGLDDFGYLKLMGEDGNCFSVQPDGNTFDIMHNLITIK